MPTILITGSARRIGKGLAKFFADKGWNIAIHYNQSHQSAINLLNEFNQMGIEAIAIKADLANEKEIEDGFKKIYSKFEKIDVLVNNAAIYPQQRKFEELKTEEWDRTFDINLKSYFITSQIYAKNCKNSGRIINISSLGGLEVWKNRIPYNVSKSAVIHLTKVLARNLAPKISVNCISPGVIFIENELGSEPIDIPESKIPMLRYGKISDICDAVFFFATATNYITGQILAVDGGLNLVK